MLFVEQALRSVKELFAIVLESIGGEALEESRHLLVIGVQCFVGPLPLFGPSFGGDKVGEGLVPLRSGSGQSSPSESESHHEAGDCQAKHGCDDEGWFHVFEGTCPL